MDNKVCESCETEYSLLSDKPQVYCPFCGEVCEDAVLESEDDLTYEELDFFDEE
jgi:hypothetical protein